MRNIVSGLLLLGLLSSNAPGAWCQSPDQGWKQIGVRAGISATTKTEYFHKYELYATYGLPWSLRADSGFGIALQMDTSIGALHAGGETGLIGSLGPEFVIDKGGKGLAFKLGANIAGLSRYRYGNVVLNGHLIFLGHVGMLYRFDSGPGIGYQFQHLSNGGLSVGGQGDGNTGVDLHMIDLSWNFP